ncbi:hypothetical protein [Pandoraea capi]|uniref:hypothetical protein n=1 Tax=Pandoraea capi TaxID=2508286 RepID=UPI0012406128|nr:hypothetical protein [Pandoraea capi]
MHAALDLSPASRQCGASQLPLDLSTTAPGMLSVTVEHHLTTRRLVASAAAGRAPSSSEDEDSPECRPETIDGPVRSESVEVIELSKTPATSCPSLTKVLSAPGGSTLNAPQANRPLAPIVALRSAFDPLLHDASAIIFQKIMGVDVVHKTQDGWNIATPSSGIGSAHSLLQSITEPQTGAGRHSPATPS